MTVKVVDVETTGKNCEEHEVVEIGAIDLDTGKEYHSFVSPSDAIPAEAMSVHHITDEDVAEAPDWGSVYQDVLGDDRIRVAHNAPFDAGFCGEDGSRWIDTLRLAKHTYDLGLYNLQYLRYKLDLETGIKGGAHRALDDAKVCMALYKRLEEDTGLNTQEMLEKQKQPVWQSVCRWGKKYHGIAWDKVPSDYMKWALNKADYLDEDARYNMQLRLKERGGV